MKKSCSNNDDVYIRRHQIRPGMAFKTFYSSTDQPVLYFVIGVHVHKLSGAIDITYITPGPDIGQIRIFCRCAVPNEQTWRKDDIL